MKKTIIGLFFVLLTFSAVSAEQIISCYGQDEQSEVKIILARQHNNTFTYVTDGMDEEDIQVQKLNQIYNNNKTVGYKTTNGNMPFLVRIPKSVIGQNTGGFFVMVECSDPLSGFDEKGEVFEKCTSELKY